MDDDMILDLYWAREDSAIVETAKKFGGFCYSVAQNILRNIEDAEECVSDTYLRAWEAIPPQRPLYFRAYLGKITRNLSLTRYKRLKSPKNGGGEIPLLLDELDECVPSGGGVEREFEAKQVTEVLNTFLFYLDKESRTVFTRRYWYADSIQAIAERLGMSESKVKSMLFRIRGKLKTYLEQEGVAV